MSAISEDDVARLKNAINPPTAENVVEHRIKPTIIRRRRKAEEADPPVEEQESAQEEAADTIPESAQPLEEGRKEGSGSTSPGRTPQQEKAPAPATKSSSN